MSDSCAKDLADAFYSLENSEFFRLQRNFPEQRALVRELVSQARKLGPAEFRTFSRELVRIISAYCHDEAFNPGVLYRAFDGLDDVLEIDYFETPEMKPVNTGGERLYEGGGVGVQTSYSTILKVLEHLKLPANPHLVDLGSGFGRVGLAAGLWREDLQFSGYEFVGNRVKAANDSAARAGLGSRIRFMQQDLGDADFEIPAADVYYLYDPFSESTYQRVFARLANLRKERDITIIAKAGAKANFLRWMKEESWQKPDSIDDGTIHIYRA